MKFAYASELILLKSQGFLKRLDDEAVREGVMKSPYRFGKKLEWGKQLGLGKEANDVYYAGEVKQSDVVPR